jgi:hypothetical protein
VFKKIIICIALFFLFSLNCYAADWKFYSADTDDSLYFFDKESIVHLPRDIVQVWTKCVESEKYKEQMRGISVDSLSPGPSSQRERDKLEEAVARSKRVSYEVTLKEINCKTRTTRRLTESQYAEDGGLVETTSQKDLSYIDEKTGRSPYIKPGSIDEILYNIVCKKMSKDKQKKGESPLNNE